MDLDEQPTYFIPRPNNVTSLKGETVKLQCSIENLGSKFVVWRKASDPHPISVGTFIYSPDKRFNVSFSPTRREFNLVLQDVQSSDEGVYECQVSSKNKLIRHILLTVNKTNPSESSKLRNLQNISPHNPDIVLEGKEFINSGEILRLMCNVSGVQEMSQDLDWFKDGNLLKPSRYKRISIEKQNFLTNRMLTSVLEIEKSSAVDTGTYVCRNSDLLIASKKVIVLSEEKSNPDKRGTTGETKNCQIIHGQFWTMCLTTMIISVVAKGCFYLT
ncbi:hypothetical protein ACJMK2_043958 [Sinanodonta woodiana]|uniref:Ig-like domain-containing protein n=1 Tax=Sinanodonta woodiana TaxID=1069815 RepID=A0ABD3W1Q2_SINWO